jgi:4-hydroxybenzoate polyprenyltransferase
MQEIAIDHSRRSLWVARMLRWPNLILLGAIQYLVFSYDHPGSAMFVGCVLAMTLCSAAGGYVINDISDIKTDQWNHRKNAISLGWISEALARKIYTSCVAIGALITVVLAWRWSPHFIWIYPGMTILLWWYSRSLKALPLIGNIAVAFFCTAAIMIVWFPVVAPELIPREITLLAGFAFLVTLIREVVKDMEDLPGDCQSGYRTLPIVYGVRFSKFLVFTMLLITTGVLVWLMAITAILGLFTLTCFVITIALLATSGVLLYVSTDRRSEYHRVSLLLKIAMLSGALSLLI